MPNTFELIASSTVGAGGAASIDFTSIPSTYTDLKILMSLRSNGAFTGVDNLLYQFNSSTSGYSSRVLYSYSSGTPASRTTTTLTKGSTVWGRIGDSEIPFATATANTFANIEMYIPNYLSSNNKSFSVDVVAENNSSSNTSLELIAGLWSNSAAITSISFTPYNADFSQYSTIYLYGVKNA